MSTRRKFSTPLRCDWRQIIVLHCTLERPGLWKDAQLYCRDFPEAKTSRGLFPRYFHFALEYYSVFFEVTCIFELGMVRGCLEGTESLTMFQKWLKECEFGPNIQIDFMIKVSCVKNSCLPCRNRRKPHRAINTPFALLDHVNCFQIHFR